jgi:hypothetical protein
MLAERRMYRIPRESKFCQVPICKHNRPLFLFLSVWIGILLSVYLFFHCLPTTSSSPARNSLMAATASLTTTAPSPPALLKASAPLLISFRPVSRHCKNLCIKTKVSCFVLPTSRNGRTYFQCSSLSTSAGVLG